MVFEQVAIAGYGEADYHKKPDRSSFDYISESVDRALDDSGVSYEDVDGLSLVTHELHRDNEVALAQHLGIDGKWFLGDSTGNAAGIVGLLRGARAIEAGQAETVLVVAADASSPQKNMELMDEFNTGLYNYMRPYGFGGANGLFALLQQRHMSEHGTTREQLSDIAITQREHALANERALFDEPLTREDYLSARPIVEPLHLFDCVMPCGGGGAVVLTSRERATELGVDPVYIRSGDEYHDPNPTDPFSLSTGFRELDLFDSVDLSDLDAAQLYDNYPIWVAVQLEEFGFCPEGESGTFIEENDLSTTGDLPLNTGGGQLSVGQANAGGSILHTIEAIRQIRGEGGGRQVPDCSTVLASGFGMVAYGGGLSYSGVVLDAEPPQEARA